jgi:glycosyltransferase involved in cell wall biosynthesis
MTERVAVSVIIPVFRRSTFPRTLRSLQSQTLPASEFEAILVFDGNRPERFASKDVECTEFRLRMIDQEQSGAAAARNRGALKARGRILVFLDDDIEAAPDLLKIDLAAQDSTDKPRVLFGPVGTDTISRYFSAPEYG